MKYVVCKLGSAESEALFLATYRRSVGRRCMLSRFAQIVVLGFGVTVGISLYVHSTLNAVHDSYQAGIEAFKYPFYATGMAALFVALAALAAMAFVPTFRRKWHSVVGAFGIAAIAASLVVLLLGQAPCLRPHPTTGPHDAHHNLAGVVERSLLCPRYSSRSYPLLAVWLSVGAALVVAAQRARAAAGLHV